MSGGRTVIRAPNHLGDLVLALPALAAAPEADVLVLRALAPLLALQPRSGAVLPFARGGAGLRHAARLLRAARYQRGVLLTPSFSSALMLVLGRVPERRGVATGGRSLLLTDPVALELRGRHRTDVYLELVTNVPPTVAAVPRLSVPASLRSRWREELGPARGLTVGLCPASHASSRRWDADRFAAVARQFAAEGAQVVVFGSAAEAPLTRLVAAGVAWDAGGRTDLPVLAAALAECDILITNDSGPQHLAAAVGTPTVGLWGAGDPRETGVRSAVHVMLRHDELPCVPCVRNECPRRGPGYQLEQAERECLRLIGVQDVLAAGRAARA